MNELTVIMPVYNGEQYLAAAIESVLGQSFSSFTFLIINDGSTDGSQRIIEHYAALDERIVPLWQPNRGSAAARNEGLKKAKTEWVALIDADDIMLPMRLERQIAFCQQNPEVKVASCRAVYIDEKGHELGKSVNHLKNREEFNKLMAREQLIGLLQPGVLMHRETILEVGDYRKQFWPADDVDLWTRVAEQGHLILIQDEVLMKYRLHTASAITSRFIESHLQSQWVRCCMLARRRGEPEPDRDSFLHSWNSAPLVSRLNRKRIMLARHFYRRAGHRLVGRYWLRGGIELALATILQPTYVIRRLQMQMIR